MARSLWPGGRQQAVAARAKRSGSLITGHGNPGEQRSGPSQISTQRSGCSPGLQRNGAGKGSHLHAQTGQAGLEGSTGSQWPARRATMDLREPWGWSRRGSLLKDSRGLATKGHRKLKGGDGFVVWERPQLDTEDSGRGILGTESPPPEVLPAIPKSPRWG